MQVYDSLKQMEVEPDVIDYFTQEGGDELLYELRFLAAENRPNPATYIAEKQLDQRVHTISSPPPSPSPSPAPKHTCARAHVHAVLSSCSAPLNRPLGGVWACFSATSVPECAVSH